MREAVWALLTAGLLLVALAPQAVASHGEDDRCTTVHYAVDADTGGTVSTCPGGNQLPEPDQPNPPNLPLPQLPGGSEPDRECPEYGTVGNAVGEDIWLCVTLDTERPSDQAALSWLNLSGNVSSELPEVGDEACPEGTAGGVVVTYGGAQRGVCLVLIHEPFEVDPLDSHINVEAEECDVPQGGTDPAVWYNEGGIAFCAVVISEGGPAPPGGPPTPGDLPVDVDTKPCEPEAVDPTIYLFDGHVRVCVSAGVGQA